MAKGKKGSVRGLVYVSAMLVSASTSVPEALQIILSFVST